MQGALAAAIALQRPPTLAAGGRTHADWHQAVVGARDRRWLEWPLYEVLLPKDSRGAVHIAPATASLQLELTVPSLS